jgi:hypothetical protein
MRPRSGSCCQKNGRAYRQAQMLFAQGIDIKRAITKNLFILRRGFSDCREAETHVMDVCEASERFSISCRGAGLCPI